MFHRVLRGSSECCIPSPCSRITSLFGHGNPAPPDETLPPDADLETFSSSLKMVEIPVARGANGKGIGTQPNDEHNQQNTTTTPSLTEQDSQKKNRRSNKARQIRPPHNETETFVRTSRSSEQPPLQDTSQRSRIVSNHHAEEKRVK